MFLSIFFAIFGNVFFLIALRIGAVITITRGYIVFALYDFYHMAHQNDCHDSQNKIYDYLLYLCCHGYKNSEPTWNTINAQSQATKVLYTTEKSPHFQLPVSLATAVIEAIQGTYNDTNIRNAAATNGVKSL